MRDHQTTAARTVLDAAFLDLDLADLGWSHAVRRVPLSLLDEHPNAAPARVLRVDRGGLLLVACGGARPQHVRDRCDRDDGPAAVGDWVLVDPPALGADGFGFARARIPRSGVLARRRDTSSTQPQLLAANVDVVLVVEALDPDRQPNAGRIARLTALAAAADVNTYVVLTHADRVDAPPVALAGHAPITTSIVDGRGLDELRGLVSAGLTVTLVGASGSGKSSLVNALLGHDVRAVSAQRSSGTGRHTTSNGQLIPLPTGGLLVDTPGIRALGMHGDVDVADLVPAGFADIATQCRFHDCAHMSEPGCAIAAAIDAGELPADAIAMWRKLEREARREQARVDARLRREVNAERLTMLKGYERARRRGEFPQRRS